MTHVHLRQETGFTLLELLLAMFIFSIVMAGTLDLLRSQGRIVSLGGDRITAEANLEFAVATMEQRLRAAGADVLPKQPNLVYAGPNVVAFNANYTTNDANDPFAVYYDPDAPAAAVIALQQWQQFTIPNTAAVYPDTTYKQGSFDSQAETIIFYLTLDSTSGRTDLYLLMQQVNSMPPEMVSRNIVGSPTTQFFQYFKVITPVVGNPYMDSVRTASLPLFHSVPIHQSAADTGLAAVIDSVRGVQVTFTVSNGQTGAAERRASQHGTQGPHDVRCSAHSRSPAQRGLRYHTRGQADVEQGGGRGGRRQDRGALRRLAQTGDRHFLGRSLSEYPGRGPDVVPLCRRGRLPWVLLPVSVGG